MSLFDLISSQLGSGVNSQISQQLGADSGKTANAISSALPMILGAISRNAQTEEGAGALANALEKDHDGSILDNLGGFLQNAQQGSGDGILKHVLGEKRGMVEQAVAGKSGLDLASTAKLMTTLAPVILGALGKAKKEQNLDSEGLKDMLGREKAEQEARPDVDTGFVGKFLDRDGDGDIMDDIGGLLKGLF